MTLSSELLPEIREYERTSTAVINAYVGPAIAGTSAARDRLARPGIGAQLLVMQSNGGMLTPERPAQAGHVIESGPAAGVIAAATSAGSPAAAT